MDNYLGDGFRGKYRRLSHWNFEDNIFVLSELAEWLRRLAGIRATRDLAPSRSISYLIFSFFVFI